MKRFEFRLHRVLDLRRQQAEAERARLESLVAAAARLSEEIRSLGTQLDQARAHVRHAPSSAGEDFLALAHFESHIHRRTDALEKRSQQLAQEVAAQRARVVEANRKLKLLEKLESRRRSEWQAECNKELESAAAEAHLARLIADRRHSTL